MVMETPDHQMVVGNKFALGCEYGIILMRRQVFRIIFVAVKSGLVSNDQVVA
jgi:hypothetical protein